VGQRLGGTSEWREDRGKKRMQLRASKVTRWRSLPTKEMRVGTGRRLEKAGGGRRERAGGGHHALSLPETGRTGGEICE
jgi:hypothetical protein